MLGDCTIVCIPVRRGKRGLQRWTSRSRGEEMNGTKVRMLTASVTDGRRPSFASSSCVTADWSDRDDLVSELPPSSRHRSSPDVSPQTDLASIARGEPKAGSVVRAFSPPGRCGDSEPTTADRGHATFIRARRRDSGPQAQARLGSPQMEARQKGRSEARQLFELGKVGLGGG